MSSNIINEIDELETRVVDLETLLQTKTAQLEDSTTMGLMLTTMLDIEKILSAMMEMAIRTVNAEVGCIMLKDGDTLKTRISWGLDDHVVSSVRIDDDLDIANWVFREGRGIVLSEFPPQNNFAGQISSAMAVPLTTHEKTIGVVVIVNKVTGDPFGSNDQQSLESLVRFAAVAIENANLMAEKLKKQKMEQELELAHEVQQALLPRSDETFTRAVLEASYEPAGQVGGDYYDIIRLSDDRFVVIVGDVSNKGVPAALMMTAVRSVFRLQTGHGGEIEKKIRELNTFLCDQVLRTENMFISLTYACFDLEKMICRYVNAGHLPPVHFRKSKNDLYLWKRGGVILGQFPNFSFQSEDVKLNRGDRILFYTDGINESENAAGELYGRERLHRFVLDNSSLKPAEFNNKLISTVRSFSNGATETDDITLLMVEMK